MIVIGNKIGERYEIIGNIGNGGMANVYLALDLILNREVAIKVLRFDFQDDQDAIRRFQREALAATEMVHPNIVSVYDVGEENGMQYIVMEYVKGTDLKKYIRDNSPIPLLTVVDLMEQILSAISVAHQHQIIHRDLKPQNILVDQDGTAKITDFGIAIALSETSITQTNTLLGSVHYLSPEQARGGMATRQSDIYALGIILYELLTGSVPFEGESAVSIALKHFQNDMPSVRRFNPEIPQALENVVLHATAKEVADRYQSIDEMYADLRTVLDPARANEPVFEPTVMTDETIRLTPINEEDYQPETVQAAVKQPDFDDDDDDDYEEKKPRKKWKKFVAIGIFLVLAVAGSLFALGMRKGDAVIPDIKGKTVEEATLVLNEKKIKVNGTEEIADDTIEKGKVVKTSPPIGTKVKSKSGIKIYVSSGEKSISMKDYTDEEVTDAKDDLLSKGFKDENIEMVKQNSDSVAENRVIKQTPKSGRKVVPEETKVTLIVSKGAKAFRLENMYGYSRNRAMSYLDSVNLVYREGSSEYNNNVPAGQVIYTIPSGGSEVAKGAEVTVVLSAGKDPSTLPSSSSSSSSTPSEETSETTTSSESPDDSTQHSKTQDNKNDGESRK
ncbi:Stk1 family PASTA domain-containing Ser/Thr kinase [Vagococcus silagei]|uniref:non-specific serine/threonine protein kinase n=1 Tax=Vagococcus silagei TaxID=2508885 RepID=A0A4S3B861_9ENTE|nr:Stk1 family PASTA domain-containing Ser/Thr kinase [Vagococcus silagei]THB61035.1 Stk1 family PASTA domain-containing Ser/Thr kinase [Vagococcus silagei]